MRKLALITILAILLLACQAAAPAVVVRVVDGDTIVVDLAGKIEHIRLLGVDAPELHDKFTHQPSPTGRIAKEFMARLLPPGTVMKLEFDRVSGRRDHFRRLLAYVYLMDGRMANLEIIRAGYAKTLIRYPFAKRKDFPPAK
jgi:micrococcal nuclease